MAFPPVGNASRRSKLWRTGLLVVAIWCVPLSTNADDPLDDTDGTEGWDQVVEPQPKPARDAQPEDRTSFRDEIADWEKIRQLWQEQRELYSMEKSEQQRLLKQLRTAKKLKVPEASQEDASDNEWGDDAGQRVWVPDSSLDKAIDGELGNAGRPAEKHEPTTPSSKASPPAKSSPDAGEELPSAFRQPTRDGDGEEEDAKEREAQLKREAEERRKQEVEEQKEREQEEKRRREEAEAKQKADEAEAAAAAARLLKQQEEEIRREQEALQKKAKLSTDSEGQMVDPELQNEQDKDKPKEQPEED